MELVWNGEKVADIPLDPLADEAPLYERPYAIPKPPEPLTDIPESTDIAADLLKLIASPALASRRWVWEQYDQTVGGDTVQPPGGDAAVVRVHGTKSAGDHHRRHSALLLRRPVRRRQAGGRGKPTATSAVGARPLAITNCLNFGNPQRPEIMGQLVGCIEGMAEACRALDFPVVSGNVSLYNETKNEDGSSQAILPTPAIGGVGLLQDWRRAATIAFKAEGEEILLIGADGAHLGQSIWLQQIHDRRDGLALRRFARRRALRRFQVDARLRVAAVVRVHGTRKALAITTDVTPRYCFADPFEGGKQAVAEAYRNLSAVGARPLAITNCLNFGNPQRPEIMGQLVGCIEGMAEACRALDFPVVSGNVSLYNETKNEDGSSQAILPTPAIGGVGLLDDWRKAATIGFKAEGEEILLIGEDGQHLGQSLWLREIHRRAYGPPPVVSLQAERRAADFILMLIGSGDATSVHDISDGGLLVAVAEMALAGGIGATLVEMSTAEAFGEDQGRFVITVPSGFYSSLIEVPLNVQRIGTTGGEAFSMGEQSVPLTDLRAAHDGFFPKLMGADAALA